MKAVVVTGATGGIGRAVARSLGSAGYAVFVHYAADSVGASKLVRSLEADGGRAFAIGADLRTADGIEDLVRGVGMVLDENPELQLWGVINNAALMLGPSFADATYADFERFFAVNVRAPFFLAQRLAERMSDGGSIVNISSAGAHFSSPGDIVYAMSKAALESLTTHAAEALAHRRIRINTVIPGFTDNGSELLDRPGVREYVGSFAVQGGIAEASTVAEAVDFLLSPSSKRTTGAALDVSGGSMLGARHTTAVRVSLRGVLDQVD